jgi:hypothetical protein
VLIQGDELAGMDMLSEAERIKQDVKMQAAKALGQGIVDNDAEGGWHDDWLEDVCGKSGVVALDANLD